jgi:general stress protein 26
MQSDSKNSNAAIKLKEKIDKVKIAMLTTEEKDGHLRSRPMHTTKAESTGILWFFTSDQSDKADVIEHKNRSVNLAYADADADTYISVSGKAEIVEDKGKMKDLWNPALKGWFAQGLDTPDISLLKITVDKAEYWDVKSNKMVQLAAFAKAAITGKSAREDIGNSEKLNVR